MSYSHQQFSKTLSAKTRRLSNISSATVSFLSPLTWTLLRSGSSLPASNGMFSFIWSRRGILQKKDFSSVFTIGSVFTCAILGLTSDLRFLFLFLSLQVQLHFKKEIIPKTDPPPHPKGDFHYPQFFSLSPLRKLRISLSPPNVHYPPHQFTIFTIPPPTQSRFSLSPPQSKVHFHYPPQNKFSVPPHFPLILIGLGASWVQKS